jgi:hypothetical protein
VKALAVVAALATLPACGAAPGTGSSDPSVSSRPDPSRREQSRSDSFGSSPARDPGGRSPHDKSGKK